MTPYRASPWHFLHGSWPPRRSGLQVLRIGAGFPQGLARPLSGLRHRSLSTAHTFPRSTPALVVDHSATARLGINIVAYATAAFPDPGCVAVQRLQVLLYRLASIVPALSLRDLTIPTNRYWFSG